MSSDEHDPTNPTPPSPSASSTTQDTPLEVSGEGLSQVAANPVTKPATPTEVSVSQDPVASAEAASPESTSPAQTEPAVPPGDNPVLAETPPTSVDISGGSAVPAEPGQPQKSATVEDAPSSSSAESAPRQIKIGSQREGVSTKSSTTPHQPAAVPSSSAENPPPAEKVPVPNLREGLPPEVQSEIEQALGDMPVESLMEEESQTSESLEPHTRLTGRVVSIHKDTVFFDLGQRNQGIIPLEKLGEPPQIGATFEVIVQRFQPEDGLYELSLPGAAADVGDWSDINVGMVVETRITGTNKGGLECEVNRIRGFIPASQVSLYRVENLEQFVGQTLNCVITEAKQERRNLVLSHRALLEREQQEAREKLLEELAVGQVREGVVRNLQPFGAFVDLGGVDGLIHISQLSWERIKHPSEVLEPGQRVKVRIQKIDAATRKIGLAFRDLLESPWANAEQKYPPGTRCKGTVTKILDFGAFVRLEPGVEGMIHISELAHRRVAKVSDVVQPDQEIEAQVLSVDKEKQRIALSLKALEAPPPEAAASETSEPEPDERERARRKKQNSRLQGGVGGQSGGERFGLKW